MKKINCIYKFVTTCFLLFLLPITAQEKNLLADQYFGFEDSKNGWDTNNTNNWSRSSAKKSSGSYSLKFSLEKDFPSLKSFDTGLTISKVRTANYKKHTYIVSSSYEGVVQGYRYDGKLLWSNELSGFMNHDLWCADVTNDGIDEVFAANADGNLYCLSGEGELLWNFKPSETPMYSVCVVEKDDEKYVVCGGYDKSFYYLTKDGEVEKTIASNSYSVNRPFGNLPKPPNNTHTVNFLRPAKNADGSTSLVLLGTHNTMQFPGTIYLFDVLASLPKSSTKVGTAKPVGDVRMVDVDNDGNEEVLFGASSHISDASISEFDRNSLSDAYFDLSTLRNKIDGFGYRVVQTEVIPKNGTYEYFVLLGASIVLVPSNRDLNDAEILQSKYSFNDMWKDAKNNRMILASAQSGGSNIHVLNLNKSEWKTAYKNLTPTGKIEKILANTNSLKNNLKNFQKPNFQRTTKPVYFLTEKLEGSVASFVNNLTSQFDSPQFFNSTFMPKVENWDRSGMENEVYKNKRDQRKEYSLTSQQVQDILIPSFNGYPGISYWGGHGNDPYMISLETEKKIINAANGKKTVMIFPELEGHSDDFAWVMDDLFYPLAEHSKTRNANISVRTKHTFWQSIIYLPLWSDLISGKYADVFVPSMEETTGKTMDTSVSGRLGVWMSGSVNNWGSRSVPDNASFDRLRQHSHQKIPNHFLRQMVYNISYGATYLNNFPVDQEYMSVLWELIAKGALYVPERSEILSFSPVHLSVLNPDERNIYEGNSVKWTTFYDEQLEKNEPMVFSRMNGTWPGAPVNEWDFSKYAAGVKDRRLHFLPNYSKGMVLITPPQSGVHADANAVRNKLDSYMHPMYKGIMNEYYTNGKDYFNANGSVKYNPTTYYKTIEDAISAGASKLPITVEGDVAWVVAQIDATHLRLTLIDNGYINPNDREATVKFNGISVVKLKDVLDSKEYSIDNGVAKIDVPCGLFRFIDVELSNPLTE